MRNEDEGRKERLYLLLMKVLPPMIVKDRLAEWVIMTFFQASAVIDSQLYVGSIERSVT